MQKVLMLVFFVVLMSSCAVSEYAVDDEIVEMNWNSAVKDLYMMEDAVRDEAEIDSVANRQLNFLTEK